jgi:hypothetical protein
MVNNIDNISDDIYRQKIRDVLRSWSKLDTDPLRARDSLLALSTTDFIQDYTPFTFQRASEFVDYYWFYLSYEALRLLADDIDRSARDAFEEMKQFKKFPLVRPQDTPEELSRDEFENAVSHLAKVKPRVNRSDKDTLGAGEEIGNAQIDEQLLRLQGIQLDDGREKTWLRGVEQVLGSFSADAESIPCALKILNIKKQQTLFGQHNKNFNEQTLASFWKIIILKQGDAVMGTKRVDQTADTVLGEVQCPGRPLELQFKTHPSDTEPDRVIKIPGLWAPLRLLHKFNAESAHTGKRDDPFNAWNIELSLQDDQGQDYYLYLQIDFFDRSMPSLDQWPTLSGS